MAAVTPTIDQAAFVGARDGELFQRLTSLGVPLVPYDSLTSPKLTIIDAETLTDAMLPAAKKITDTTIAAKGTVFVLLRKQDQALAAVNQLLPEPVTLTSRTATALVGRQSDPWTAGFGLADLYFAEDAADKRILKCGLDGPFVKRGRVLLDAGNTDWSLFNDQPENAKCAAVVLSEHLIKPSGAALVTLPQGEGTFAVSAMNCVLKSPAHAKFWRTLFANMGVRLVSESAAVDIQSKDKPHDLLLNGPPENKP